MKVISFEKLYNTEFYITQPIAHVQYWAPRGNIYSAIGKPKISHTLLWFKNCSATITSKDGTVLEVIMTALNDNGGEFILSDGVSELGNNTEIIVTPDGEDYFSLSRYTELYIDTTPITVK